MAYTPQDVEDARRRLVAAILDSDLMAETQIDATGSGLFAVDADGFGYYITVQSLAVTDPMYLRLQGILGPGTTES